MGTAELGTPGAEGPAPANPRPGAMQAPRCPSGDFLFFFFREKEEKNGSCFFMCRSQFLNIGNGFKCFWTYCVGQTK